VGLDNDDVEKRPAEHASLYPHYIDQWAGVITGVACLPHTLEDKLKASFRNSTGVLVLDGHKREEFLIPEQVAHETVNDVTRDLERTLSTRVLGTHAVARALADGGSEYSKGHAVPQAVEQAFDAALTGNAHVVSSEQRVVTQTQIALACEQTKQAEHAANRERSAAVKDLASKGFSFEQIQALLPCS
jgi:hypothetical protein